MRKIKAIFFDIDGTLVDLRTRIVPDSTKDSLNILRQKGIKLFVCSGRHPSFRQKLIEEVGFVFDAYIFCNGQYITDKDGNPLYKLSFDDKTKVKLYNFIKSHQWLSVHIMEEDKVYSAGKNFGPYENHHEEYNLERMLKNDVYQVCPKGLEFIDKLILRNNPGAKSARWHWSFADIIPVNGGKDRGIEKILNIFKFDIENTMAFGDADNDIPMLKACNIGIAMGNGTRRAKRASNYITESVKDDGIYKALKHFEVI